MNNRKKYLAIFSIVVTVLMLVLNINFYLEYLWHYEYQVHQMKILYDKNDPDILSREDEINQILLFCKIIFTYLFLILLSQIMFLVDRSKSKE
ncbi:MAG: hypothetical protein JWO58_3120 [Chitinophagaceae bacterium]|nr:hypothetical protein [Chitinophagaceae bacterium]